MHLRPILLALASCAAFTMFTACDDKKEEKTEKKSKKSGGDDDDDKPKKKKAKPLDLAKVTDDELKDAVTAAGYDDPWVYRPKLDEPDHSEVSVSVKKPKVKAIIYNFGVEHPNEKRVPHVKDINDKRVLCTDGSTDFADQKTVAATAAVLKKSDCEDAASCGKALKDAGYSDLSGHDSSVQLGPLMYSYLTAQKGGKYVQVKVYVYKHSKLEIVSRVSGNIVAIAMPDGEEPVAKDKLTKFLDAVK